ncbi:AzlD domain-containing protein [Propionivibrio sp.]|uniref:AzlD domain-containing protein n=1 Tax=Propionivibrio sp. TaxID=2212460 RepID=UPI003BEFB1E5
MLIAVVLPGRLFFPGGTPTIEPDTPRHVAATLALLIAWRTLRVLWSVILGICAMRRLQILVR